MSNGTTNTPEIINELQATMQESYKSMHDTVCSLTGLEILGMIFGSAAAFTVGLVFILAKLVLLVLTLFGLPVAIAVIKGMGVLRTSGSPELNELITSSMTEFFGVEFTADDLPLVQGKNTVRDRAKAIGHKFHTLLRDEFGLTTDISGSSGKTMIGPDPSAAEAFSGFSIDFSVFTALIGLLGEIESLGKFEQFKELGGDIAHNLALGRLHRLAMQPLLQDAVQTPLQWSLRRQLRPTLLAEKDIVTAVLSQEMSWEDGYEEMARLGYSVDRANTLFRHLQIHLTPTECETLVRWQIITRDDAVKLLKRGGYSEDVARLALNAVVAARMDLQEKQDLDLLRTHVANGVIDESQLDLALVPFHLEQDEIADFRRRALFQRDLPHHFLTQAQLRSAFEQGVMDVSEYTAELAREGLSPDDVQIMLILTLLDLQRKEQAAAVAATRKKKTQGAPQTPKTAT